MFICLTLNFSHLDSIFKVEQSVNHLRGFFVYFVYLVFSAQTVGHKSRFKRLCFIGVTPSFHHVE